MGNIVTFALWLQVGQGDEGVSRSHTLHGAVAGVLPATEEGKELCSRARSSYCTSTLPHERYNPHAELASRSHAFSGREGVAPLY